MRQETGTVKAAKKVAREKGNTKDYGKVSRSKEVTSPLTVKKTPTGDRSGKRAPGGKTKGV